MRFRRVRAAWECAQHFASQYPDYSLNLGGSRKGDDRALVSSAMARFHHYIRRSGLSLAISPNQIAFVWALRGTIAAGMPLLCLPPLGFGFASNFIAVGALNTSMVDIGGSYRSRLNAMAFNGLASPLALLLGSQAREPWWLAAAMMFIVALGSGLARAIGPGGVPLGLMIGTGFLIGTSVPAALNEDIEFAMQYAAGAFWTILVALVFWRLRPFKRLEQEVAAVWERTAALIGAIHAVEADMKSVVGRRRRERVLASNHQALREAVERARGALGVIRAEISGPGTTTAQLMILVRAASRVAAAGVTLAEIHGRDLQDRRVYDDDDIFGTTTNELESACRAIAASVLAGRRQLSLTAMRTRLIQLTSAFGGMHPQVMTFAQAIRHLENATEAMDLLLGQEQRFYGVLLPPLSSGNPSGNVLHALRAQLSWRSAIFRHAIRVAVCSAVGTAIMIKFDVPHGIWLPMTTLIVLQPEFGGTLSLAVQRTIGTAAGAVIAGLLLATLHGTRALEFAVLVLLFAALFVQRRRYGLGVTFLTPLIVLLLATSIGDPWTDTLDRVMDTIAGAAVGIIAGYFLWPQWERERLPAQLARAIRANRDYMVHVFAALGGERVPSGIGEFRRQAEIATGNAEAGFQRLLSEPRIQRGRIARAFAIVTYVQRLERHLIALAAHIGSIAVPETDLQALLHSLEKVQEDIAAAVAEDRIPLPCPAFDAALGRLRTILVDHEAVDTAQLIEFLLGKIVSDTTSLHLAASTK
jgi:uncharacterized membrane protein YccC